MGIFFFQCTIIAIYRGKTPQDNLIEEGFLSDEFVQRIPELSVFDIETLEVEGEEGYVHKLCSIAMSSEIDSESKYWVIDASDEEQRQTIGFNFFLVSFSISI